MKQKNTFITIILVIGFSISSYAIDYKTIDTYSENKYLNMVVEIPAGTSTKIEYNYFFNKFMPDEINGKPRIVNFMPYPANYGFIPSTLMNSASGGDGDPLDVLLIAESIKTGTVIEIIPIGILVLNDLNENDSKIIAIPVDPMLRIINVESFKELKQHHNAILDLIRLWFLNYKNNNAIKFEYWGDELVAKNEIRKWSLNKNKD